jgi:hypothetical protein
MIVIPRRRHVLGVALAVALAVAPLAGCGEGGGAGDAPPARTALVERGAVGPARDVLVVPTAAVIKQGDQSYVTVPGLDGRPLLLPFQPGAVGGDVTEVKSGLVEGQPILLPPM